MKSVIILLAVVCCMHTASAQSGLPQEITPEIQKQINTQADKETEAYRKTLNIDSLSAGEIEFITDTFRINRIAEKMMETDYSTLGMNMATRESTRLYDKLMNKYYNKLLAILSPADKKVLVTAQRAWLSFRDAEQKLLFTLAKDEYSGGGSIQSIIVTGRIAGIVEQRTLELYNYFSETIAEQAP